MGSFSFAVFTLLLDDYHYLSSVLKLFTEVAEVQKGLVMIGAGLLVDVKAILHPVVITIVLKGSLITKGLSLAVSVVTTCSQQSSRAHASESCH